ncbi:MAG: hypothetical protein IIA45_14540 [Bacteroidetes bacterium]|nr:hypothetical protein [Bacteroidota bacterium]
MWLFLGSTFSAGLAPPKRFAKAMLADSVDKAVANDKRNIEVAMILSGTSRCGSFRQKADKHLLL